MSDENNGSGLLDAEMYQHLLNAVCLLITVTLKDKNTIDINDLDDGIMDDFCKIRDWITQE